MKLVGTGAALLAGIAAIAAYAQGATPQPTQVTVSSDKAYRWGEPEIAVNPRNPDNLVITATRSDFTYSCKASNAQKCQMVMAKSQHLQPYGMLFDVPGFSAVVTFASFDRGKSWKGVPMPAISGHPELVLGGHPTATAGPDGIFYVAWNVMRFEDLPTIPVSHGAVVVSRSSDGGRSWSTPVLSGTPVDHPYISADLAAGKIYVAAGAPGTLGTMSTADPKAVEGKLRDRFLASSSDGRGWTPPQPFGVPAGGSSMSAAHGALATAFRSTSPDLCGVPAPANCTIFQVTPDGGAHWSRQRLSVPGAYVGSPLVAADPARNGHFAVALLVNGESEYQVYQTRDAGKSWTAPVAVADGVRRKLYHGWLAYSPKGVLGLAWRTREPVAEGPAPYDVWAAIAVDGGGAFSQPLKVSSSTSPAPDANPPFAGSIDGRTTITLGPDTAYVTWGDWRTGDTSVAFSAIGLKAFKAK